MPAQVVHERRPPNVEPGRPARGVGEPGPDLPAAGGSGPGPMGRIALAHRPHRQVDVGRPGNRLLPAQRRGHGRECESRPGVTPTRAPVRDRRARRRGMWRKAVAIATGSSDPARATTRAPGTPPPHRVPPPAAPSPAVAGANRAWPAAPTPRDSTTDRTPRRLPVVLERPGARNARSSTRRTSPRSRSTDSESWFGRSRSAVRGSEWYGSWSNGRTAGRCPGAAGRAGPHRSSRRVRTGTAGGRPRRPAPRGRPCRRRAGRRAAPGLQVVRRTADDTGHDPARRACRPGRRHPPAQAPDERGCRLGPGVRHEAPPGPPEGVGGGRSGSRDSGQRRPKSVTADPIDR